MKEKSEEILTKYKDFREMVAQIADELENFKQVAQAS